MMARITSLIHVSHISMIYFSPGVRSDNCPLIQLIQSKDFSICLYIYFVEQQQSSVGQPQFDTVWPTEKHSFETNVKSCCTK